MSDLGEDRYSKREWRARLLAARRLVQTAERESEAMALAAWTTSIPGDTVCCYLPVGTEPGSLELVTSLATQGRRVLLPIVVGPAPLDWAAYDGTLAPGPFGLQEPGGPRLGADAIASADAVVVPALAVDIAGHRLGRGGGHYDRSLPLASPEAPRVAVVRDVEVVTELPAESHDVIMTAVLTPIGGLRQLG